MFTPEERNQLLAELTAAARGLDSLPAEFTAAVSMALVRSLEVSELVRAFRVALGALITEIRTVDAGLAERLRAPLTELAAPLTELAAGPH